MKRQESGELIYFVSGLWCQTCGSTVESMTSRSPEVEKSRLNFATKILTITPRESVDPEKVHQGILELTVPSGFALKRLESGWLHGFKQQLQEEMQRRIRPVQTAIVFFLAMWSSTFAFAGYIGGLPPEQDYLLACLTTVAGLPAVLLGVQPFARAGIRALLSGRTLTLDLFISIGAVSAASVSLIYLYQGKASTYADSAAMILAILLLAKLLDANLSHALSSRILNTVKPLQESVRVFRQESWKERPVSQIRKGERLRLEPGATVPVDGYVRGAGARVDRHLVSGETTIYDLQEGDEILAGFVAHTALEMEVSRPMGGRTIDAWAESALVSPGRDHVFSNLLKHLEQRLVQLALAGSVLVAAIRTGVTNSAEEGLEGFFVGVLIFCPCLFAGILPLARQMIALRLRRWGVLLQRPEALFDLLTIERIYLDKTGTLEGLNTHFEPLSEDPTRVQTAQNLLSNLRVHCRHPVLRGLQQAGEEARASGAPLAVREDAGQGVSADFPEGTLTVGRPEYVRRQIGASSGGPETHYPLVALDRSVVGILVSKAHFDHLAAKFLDELAEETNGGLTVEILSGDPDPEAAARYSTGKWPLIYSGDLSPEEKADRIVNPALFVGDGLNDSPALGRARVSCRIGERARDFVPVDLHILGSNLPALLRVLNYARRFVQVLKQTTALAFLYNVIAISLAAAGLFSPLGAALAMLTSFLVLLSSVSRLLF
ncbi:MAG: hypothetical protein WC314_16095 [Vulcanimicrobiota bacterium]